MSGRFTFCRRWKQPNRRRAKVGCGNGYGHLVREDTLCVIYMLKAAIALQFAAGTSR